AENAYPCDNCLYISRVITDAGRVYLAVTHLNFYLQALLKDRVHVRVQDDQGAAARASARGDDVADGVASNVERFVAAQDALDEGGALLLLARRRVYLGDSYPLLEYPVAILLNVGEGRLHFG